MILFWVQYLEQSSAWVAMEVAKSKFIDLIPVNQVSILN